jgi:hypothetical protein
MPPKPTITKNKGSILKKKKNKTSTVTLSSVRFDEKIDVQRIEEHQDSYAGNSVSGLPPAQTSLDRVGFEQMSTEKMLCISFGEL